MNPWLDIPLDEYEAHMSAASVAQAQFLAETLARCARTCHPESVCILGCAGGNGFDALARSSVRRVVGVDINPDYLATTRRRYGDSFGTLELYCEDLTAPSCFFDPVDLVYAGLIFEYVDSRSALEAITRFLRPGGFLSVTLQLPHVTHPAVSVSPYASLAGLSAIMNFVSPADLESHARTLGFSVRLGRRVVLGSGKAFHEFLFSFGRLTDEVQSSRRSE
jgi:SAM-dependent methyltransferase